VSASNTRRTTRARARSFVLRLWPEHREIEGEALFWRGSISELDGSRMRYFDHAAGLARILVEATGAQSLVDQPRRPGDG
jgi:hypothetical protein